MSWPAAGCRLLSLDEPEDTGSHQVAPSTVEQVRAVLARRARAVRRGDRAAYAATLAPGPAAPPGARRRQLRLSANLQDLPVERFPHVVDPTTVVRTEGGVVAEVTTVLQLRGFDQLPVRTPALFRFAALRRPDGATRYRLVSDRDEDRSRARGIGPQPWLVARLVVRRRRRPAGALPGARRAGCRAARLDTRGPAPADARAGRRVRASTRCPPTPPSTGRTPVPTTAWPGGQWSTSWPPTASRPCGSSSRPCASAVRILGSVDALLLEVLGIRGHELASLAGTRIVTTFG